MGIKKKYYHKKILNLGELKMIFLFFFGGGGILDSKGAWFIASFLCLLYCPFDFSIIISKVCMWGVKVSCFETGEGKM